METICDECGEIIHEEEDRFDTDKGTLCGDCYDDYCITLANRC